MKSRQLIAALVTAALASAGTAAFAQTQEKKERASSDASAGKQQGASRGASGSKQQGGSGASAPSNAPLIVLVPIPVAASAAFANGCWVRLYDGTDFKGNQLSLVGPVDMPNMRTAFGTDWSGQFDSIEVGPKARLTVYDNENYKEKAATFKPGQKVKDLDEKMALFEQIRSAKVACTGGGQTAEKGAGSTASAGGSFSSGSSPPSSSGSSRSGK
jgi:hypothetical protein